MRPEPSREELFDLAFKDDLTSLFNRRYLQTTLAPALEQASPREPYCFLLLDVDYFKEINDTYGHKDGDRALVSVAELLTRNLRKDQTAIRYAGDEFILFLPGLGQEEGLKQATEIVEGARAVSLTVNGGGKSIRLTFSVGVASFPLDGNGWEQVVEKADEALYAAKQMGRDRASLPPQEGSEIRRGDDLSRIFPCPDHVGRERVMRQITEILQAEKGAPPGSASTFLAVQGGQGQGKSRLLDEVLESAMDETSRALRLQGSRQMQNVPYGALIQGLLELAESEQALLHDVENDFSERDRDLWRTFFDPREEMDRQVFPEEEVQGFFEGICGRMAAGRSLVFLVDDVDLLDRETLHLFQALRSSPPQEWSFTAFVTLLDRGHETDSASTDSSLPHEPEFSSFLSDLPVPPIRLEPLEVQDVEKMITSIFPTLRVEPRFPAKLHEKSRGNPLYIEEALKLQIQAGSLVYERSAWNWRGRGLDELPDTLESLFQARLSALDPEVRGVLAKASMLGPDINPNILKEAEGLNEGHLMDLLDRARKVGVLDNASLWKSGAFKFHSKTARDFCYDQVPEEDRISWHVKIAELNELIRDLPSPLRVGPILHHYRMAGEIGRYEETQQRLTRVSPSPAITVPASLFGKKKGDRTAPVPVSGQGWNSVLSIFHLLRAAVQTARLYPETSQAVARSCTRLLDGFEEAFGHAPSVHLSEADGALLINGETPTWKGEEKSVANTFCRSLSDAGLKDLSFHKGLTLQEVQSFLSAWLSTSDRTADPSSVWSSFEEQPGMDHIQINAKVYVAVSDADLLNNGSPPPPPVPTADSPDEMSELLSSLQERIDSFRNPSLPSGSSPEELEALNKLLETIRQIMESGGAAPFLSAESSPIQADAPLSLRPDDTGNEEPRVLDQEPDTDVRSALADILSGEPNREARGYETISKKGDQAIEPLYFRLTETDDTREGRLCAQLLKSICQDLFTRITTDLERPSDPSAKKRLLQYIVPHMDNTEARKQLLRAAVQQEERSVAMEALHQIKTDFASDASSLLLELLPLLPDPMRNEACATLGQLGDPTSVPPLLHYLNQWKELKNGDRSRFQEAVCHALAHFQDPETVKALGDLLRSYSRLPWRRTAPPSLRKAALKALETIGGESVHSLLKKAESDKDPWIRHRIKHYLARKAA